MIFIDCNLDMTSMKNIGELHVFARKIGLKRRFFKPVYGRGVGGYYTITSKRILLKAVVFEAQFIDDGQTLEQLNYLS